MTEGWAMEFVPDERNDGHYFLAIPTCWLYLPIMQTNTIVTIFYGYWKLA